MLILFWVVFSLAQRLPAVVVGGSLIFLLSVGTVAYRLQRSEAG